MMEPIRTNRLVLEPFSEKHLSNDIVDWLNDPEVVRYSDQRHKEHTIETSRIYMNSFYGSPNGYWAIIIPGDPEFIVGTITAYVDDPNAVADVGILVGDKQYWRMGYGSEAFAGVVNWLFTRRGVRKVTAGTMAENMGMLGIMHQVGLQEEGRKKRYYLLDGREIDMIFGTIYAEDWPVNGWRK